MKNLLIATVCLFISGIAFSLPEGWIETSDPKAPEISYFVNNGKTISLTKISSTIMSVDESALTVKKSFEDSGASCSEISKREEGYVFSCINKNDKQQDIAKQDSVNDTKRTDDKKDSDQVTKDDSEKTGASAKHKNAYDVLVFQNQDMTNIAIMIRGATVSDLKLILDQ